MVSPSTEVDIAMMTSLTSPVRSLSHKRSIFKSEGPMPCIGEITPPRTWYWPWYCPVFSIDRRSPTCSTTHIVERSRRVSLHIGHRASSDRLFKFNPNVKINYNNDVNKIKLNGYVLNCVFDSNNGKDIRNKFYVASPNRHIDNSFEKRKR